MGGTTDYYDRQAAAYRERTRGCDLAGFYEPFLSRLPPGGHVLDAGCGPGRDTLAFLDRGFRVTAIDASPAMVELAARQTGQPARLLPFQQLDYEAVFDGVWANASLVHVPAAEIDDVVRRLARALVPGGLLHASVKTGDGERTAPDGRLFCDYSEASLRALIERQPALSLLSISTTPAAPTQLDDRVWLTALAVCEDGGA